MSEKQAYLGVDPGASGGVALIGHSKTITKKMPDTPKDVWDLFDSLALWARGNYGVFAVVEQVGGYVGGAGNTGSAMFKFGQNYGTVLTAMIGNGIQFEMATPRKWQGAFSLKKGAGEKKGPWKARLKAKAQQLFPDVDVILQTADALLLAEYIRRKRTGTL